MTNQMMTLQSYSDETTFFRSNKLPAAPARWQHLLNPEKV